MAVVYELGSGIDRKTALVNVMSGFSDMVTSCVPVQDHPKSAAPWA